MTQRSPYSLVEVNPDQPHNPQLWENSNLSSDPVAEAAETNPERLFNSENIPPNLAIISEKPWHRLVVYLKAQGLSNKELAVKFDKTIPWISQLTRQPWFRLRLVQELREAGVDAIQQTIKANALDSVLTLVEIRDDLTAPKAVRKSAADSLLDRYLGKPIQKLESEAKVLPSNAEVAALDRQIAEIEQELNESTQASEESQP